MAGRHAHGVINRLPLFRWHRAESVFPRPDTHPAEVKTIRIPARKYGWIPSRTAMAVQPHCLAQLLEFHSAKFDDHPGTPKLNCEVRRPLAVPCIPVVAMALAVVQEREPSQDFRVYVQLCRQTTPMQPNAAPVRHAMDTVGEVKPKARLDRAQRFANDRSTPWVHRGTLQILLPLQRLAPHVRG